MVDQDLKRNGQWCGKMGIGKEWVLGDVVSYIPRIRGVFSREEQHTRHAGNRTQVTYIYEVWIVDDRREQQITSLRSKKELEQAMDCLRQRAPAALFGFYDSKEYKELVYAEEEEEQLAQERAYRQRKARFEEQDRQEQERLAQNQVLTLPDGSVTSRITWDTIHQILRQPDQMGKTVPFQLVPGVPIQGQGRTFSRLVCLAGGAAQPTRILPNQLELRRLQLKVVHIKPLIHTAGVEQELMGGDTVVHAATDIVIRVELHGSGGDKVQEILGPGLLNRRSSQTIPWSRPADNIPPAGA